MFTPFPARIELGTILRNVPDCFRSPHPVVTIRDAYSFGYADRLWPVREAMRVLFRRNYDLAVADGKGNRARRRARKL